MTQVVRVNTAAPYDVTIGRGLTPTIAEHLPEAVQRVLIVRSEVLADRGEALGEAINATGREVVQAVVPDAEAGKTAQVVRQLLPKAHFACLYAKPAGRAVVDTFVKEFKQTKWIHFPWDIEYKFATPIKDGGRVVGGP